MTQGYRPDIDGLRAIAVAAVLGFHAFPQGLQGGFTGVDIFFVISGYPISGIILGELRAGTFTFAEFYARRIRRIFPALAWRLLDVEGQIAAGSFAIEPADAGADVGQGLG